jgi:hypothetical protein
MGIHLLVITNLAIVVIEYREDFVLENLVFLNFEHISPIVDNMPQHQIASTLKINKKLIQFGRNLPMFPRNIMRPSSW